MSVHDDTLQGLNEVLEYARGNLDLKTTTVDVADDEIVFYSIYGKLPESSKKKLINYANALLQMSGT